MSHSPIRILLVEDNPGDARLIREMLSDVKGTAFDLEEAVRLSEARDRLDQGDIDLVLLDLSLPDSYGFDTFQKIRTHVPTIPIVVLSGLNDETMAMKTASLSA